MLFKVELATIYTSLAGALISPQRLYEQVQCCQVSYMSWGVETIVTVSGMGTTLTTVKEGCSLNCET